MMLSLIGNEILLYGIIGPSELGYISAMDVIEALAAVEGKSIALRINSAGGSCDQGIAIYNSIKRRRGKTTIYVDSVAASIASVIAMAGDEVIMAKGSKLMVHKPWTLTQGNADDLRKMADLLDKYSEGLYDIYAERTGMSREALEELLSKETWLTDKEAVDMKFADAIEGTVTESPSVPKGMFAEIPPDVQQVEMKSTKRIDQLRLAMKIQQLRRPRST